MTHDGEYSHNALAFLCWLDTFERIDTLLLEIRHVQETIASQLRVSRFYEPLRYEDHYLWGRYSKTVPEDGTEPSAAKDWFEVLSSPSLPSCSVGCSMLAAFWCPEFPPTPDTQTFFERLCKSDDSAVYREWADIDAHSRCTARLNEEKKKISTKNLFSANEDRLYDSLRYLQLLKRDILRDKLVLAYRALEAFAWPNRKFADDERLARFLIIRRAALHSLHLRLDAFRDILSAVQEILNLSIERDPPPTVRRRRDQGIYTTDLADNCRFIEHDVKSFFDAVGGDNRIESDGQELEFIVHRYTRNYTSTYRYENIWTSTLPGERKQRQIGAGFVQSSFWMPERPDLQPIIAHEIAHLFLKSKQQDLRPRALDARNDSLTQLLRQISYIFERYAKRFRFYPFSARTREGLLREIACDLVGSAVHRTSYLFANFLELLCFGCEDMVLATESGDIAHDVSQLGGEYVTYIRDRRPEWVIRLSATLAFSNALRSRTGRPAAVLESTIHSGIEGVIGAVYRQLSQWMDGEQKEDWETWLEMTNVVVDLITNASLVKTTSTWLRSRAENAKSGNKRIWNDPGFNRYLPQLPTSIVEHCIGAWLDRLVEVPRMLGQTLNRLWPPPSSIDDEHILQQFRSLYLEAPQITPYDQKGRPELELFNHLIDIPWQTAVLTTRDFLGAPLRGPTDLRLDAVDHENWITSIHEFNWLGRDLYEFALEYAVWYERPSIGRLKGMNRWLISIRDSIEKLLKQKPGDAVLLALEELLCSILDDHGEKGPIVRSDDEAFQLYRTLIEKWREHNLQPSDHIGIVGSQAISKHYPDNDRRTAAGPKLQNKPQKGMWIHFFDFMASAHMNHAEKEICCKVRNLVDKEIDADLMQQLAQALEHPIDASMPKPKKPEDDEGRRWLFQYSRIIVELIRVAHYLDIRPETAPGGCATRHHAGKGADWPTVFARFLDVPIQARKRAGGPESKLLCGLVPTRSLRVDRLSQLYHIHKSLQAKDDAAKYPGHLAEDNFSPGRELHWIPWDENGERRTVDNEQESVKSTRLGTPLLGRFDRLMIEPAKNTARFRQYAPLIPYFRRQQIGLPFAAAIKGGRIDRAPNHETFQRAFRNIFSKPGQQSGGNPAQPSDKTPIPLATISILLVQRSARLTFVERLLAENLVMESFHPKLSSPYRYFEPQSDIGLLTDGWGDIFLVLFDKLDDQTPRTFDEYVDRCNIIRKRFDRIITLRKSIFEDTLVVRSETSYTPLAIDTALLHPRQYRCTISVRFIATRDGASLADEFENHLFDVFNGRYKSLLPILSYSSISGRNDYLITSRQNIDEGLPAAAYKQLCEGCKDYGAYGIIFESLRRIIFEPFEKYDPTFISDHVDTTTTTIGELEFPKY